MRKRSLGKPVKIQDRFTGVRHFLPAQRTAELFQQFNTALAISQVYQTKSFPGILSTLSQMLAVTPIFWTQTINRFLGVQTAMKSGMTAWTERQKTIH